MATGAIRQGSSRYDKLFFPGAAVVILVTVFLGFARTYYLAGVFRAQLPNLLVHIHGAVFSLWILLLILQTSLIASECQRPGTSTPQGGPIRLRSGVLS